MRKFLVSNFKFLTKLINRSSSGQALRFNSGQALRQNFLRLGSGQAGQALRQSSGQAAMVIVFGLGMMGVLVALGFSAFGPREVLTQKALTDSDKAYYAAQSGIEELMIRLRSHHNFGNEWTMTDELENGAVLHATISGDLSVKIATVTGTFEDYTRRIEIQLASSSSKTSFLFAVQSGTGGFELEKNTEIKGKDGAAGNIYSNGDILGENRSGGTSGSKVFGDVWAVGKISGLDGDGSGGVYVTGNVEVGDAVRCRVLGDVIAPVPPANCPYNGEYIVSEAPEPASVETIDIGFWKQQAEQSSVWVGDCVVGGKSGDCSVPDGKLGSIKIEGDLIVEPGSDFTLTGPVWVEGDVTINSNSEVYVDEALGSEGVVVVVDYPSDTFARGKIETASNVAFYQTSVGGPAVFVSTNTEDNCAAVPAIRVASNTATVVFSAPEGCVYFEANSFVRGVLAKVVHLSNNSSIEYDPRLATVILKTGLGGWAVTGYREVE